MGDRIATLESILGHHFARRDLLGLALRHASSLRNRDRRTDTNERLEFLGDRVLGLVIAAMLYEGFPDEEEGALARRHTALVRREALARVAETIGLAEHLTMAHGEAETGGRDKPTILADGCEAVLGALYLDGGLAAAEGFVRRFWAPLLAEDLRPPKDAKTTLQEWAQGRGLPLPAYREMERSGPDHAPLFVVVVEVEGMPPTPGSGPAKRAAEQAAAEALLRILAEEGKA
ncbi:MAG: ribonuclease III [Magnetospirillum sp. WYHS-4]